MTEIVVTRPWAGVRARVLALASAPGAEKVFGRHGHGFSLADPLTQDELADLEAGLGVRLPGEYRDFLLQVGAGGAGPAYGVFPVGRTAGGEWQWEGDGADMTDRGRIAEPFPVRGPDPEHLAALEAERPDEDAFAAAGGDDDDDDDGGFDAAYEAWEERWAAVLWSADRTVGAICLCHIGCAERRWLVVSGPQRGRIWADARCDDVDLEPLMTGPAKNEPATFASWYLDWLDAAIRTAGAHG